MVSYLLTHTQKEYEKVLRSLIIPRELRVVINLSILSLNRWPLTGPVSEWPSRGFQNAHDLHLCPREIRQAGDRGSLEDLGAPPSQPTPFRSYTPCKSNQLQLRPGKETDAGCPWPVTPVQPTGNRAFEHRFLTPIILELLYVYASDYTKRERLSGAEFWKKDSRRNKRLLFQELIINVILLALSKPLFSYCQKFYIGYTVNLSECNEE